MLKRILNATIAGVALIALTVPMLIVALIIKLTSPGPVFFRQQRVGKFGRPFAILKFRTMVTDASHGSAITVGRDARVTPVGFFLRKTKIDELPQLINIVKGDMNLVGPRPELPQFVRKYSAADRDLVLSVEPGLTDFASIRYRNESELLEGADNPLDYYEHVLIPRKLRYSRFYIRRAGIRLDFYVMWLTLRSLLGDAFGKASRARPQQMGNSAKGSPPRLFRTL
jgi:lipopolysaccharide/colanic/teichoic acid biosynthesis glycosyltransferase